MSHKKKRSLKAASWAMTANMPLKLKVEVILKTILAGNDPQKKSKIMHMVGERRRLTQPRDRIDWFPSIDTNLCKKCRICLSFCPKGVYSLEEDGSISVANPYECVMLCTGCQGHCPEGAISFPDKEDFNRYVYYV